MMHKEKLMARFKDKFGGKYTKEGGKNYWTLGETKILVSTGFLNHHLNNNISPVPVVEEKKEVEKPVKKVKKDVKVPTNPEVS